MTQLEESGLHLKGLDHRADKIEHEIKKKRESTRRVASSGDQLMDQVEDLFKKTIYNV